MYDFKINPINSPCKDCKNRCIGCHTIENCKKWAEYQTKKEEYNKVRRIEIMADSTKYENIQKKMKEHKQPSERVYD